MIRKIDHIAVAVENLTASAEILGKLLGISPSEVEEVAEQKVRALFFDIGGVHIELLEPTSEDSPVAGFLEKKGQGIHHIAFATDDIQNEISRLDQQGFKMIDSIPRTGAGGKKIAFIHPRSSEKVLTELCQE
ncbi:MAG: methylmalonyl-CoA epimerase [Candidatus Wallbacteria bacterium HGW-Wallbacteria-1]|jgi:methylmalonyl-CoA/ethylmalonyl-CoA epimerase|uniref:Methylmalonyl-CoA epimerase n=1 Tax=Candidatus Wallbacteria bacterium HGW-Wallbacteria-1 TaxID=2013854 RepID=A0A2N1PTE9_9BACT|nr:MAG: methylmalonyl-CoA epimerase [Candidatus Wallbacteria bacterium HGW-Wallbacteria-1]